MSNLNKIGVHAIDTTYYSITFTINGSLDRRDLMCNFSIH